MDPREAEFAAKLFATFKVEADEHLKSLSDGLLALENHLPQENQKEAIETIFREAHSLKGAARAVNHEVIQNVCQSLENVLSDLRNGNIVPSPSLFDTSYATLDFIGKFISFSDKSDSFQDKEQLQSLIQRLDRLCSSKANLSQDKTPEAPFSPYQANPQPEFKEETNNGTKASPNPEKKATIRVSTQKLDRLLQESEEMLMIKLSSAQRENDVKKALLMFKKWEKQWKRIQKDIKIFQLMFNEPSSTAESKKFSKQFLEFFDWQQDFFHSAQEHMQNLAQEATQDNRIIGSMIDNLLDDAKKVLMQPISTLYEIFPRMVRDISRSLSKEIHLNLEGGDIEVDRRILEEMKDPLTHLIRNSIDHGIESPEIREENHKPPFGTVTISASQAGGNRVEVLIIDDGAGIDSEKVKESAIKQGVISKADADKLSFDETIMLIFQSGISTSPIITELSGRGIGMGVVGEKVEKLAGQISIETHMGKGTTFRISLPLTMATFRGIHIKVSNQDFIIPTQHVKRAIKINAEDVKKLENRETIVLEEKTLSFVELSDILGIERKKQDYRKTHRYALIIKASDITLALGVDDIISEQEVFTKGLGKQLKRIKNISAATVLEGGKVIPILDPFDLIKSAIELKANKYGLPQIKTETKKEIAKTVLIAEDSLTARMLLKNILESAGYHVKIAVDGLEAFSILKNEPIDLLITDIEMPKMDGLELTQKVRAVDQYQDLPIIICTSRGSKEDKEHGIEVGANAYIDKSSFVQSNLLDIMQKLL